MPWWKCIQFYYSLLYSIETGATHYFVLNVVDQTKYIQSHHAFDRPRSSRHNWLFSEISTAFVFRSQLKTSQLKTSQLIRSERLRRRTIKPMHRQFWSRFLFIVIYYVFLQFSSQRWRSSLCRRINALTKQKCALAAPRFQLQSPCNILLINCALTPDKCSFKIGYGLFPFRSSIIKL